MKDRSEVRALPARPVRIAHAHGNRRSRIERAIEAAVDLIETDIRFDRGRVWVRHEFRFLNLPLLYNVGIRGIHRQGPWAASLGRLFVRLDVGPIAFEEILERCSGRAGMLLDFKADRYDDATARRFVKRVFDELEGAHFDGAVACCGNWRLLDFVREQRPGTDVCYSIDSESDWQAVEPRLSPGGDVTAITIQKNFLSEERGAQLRERCVRVYCWDIDNEHEARRAMDRGAAGVIADDLGLLGGLAEAVDQAEAS